MIHDGDELSCDDWQLGIFLIIVLGFDDTLYPSWIIEPEEDRPCWWSILDKMRYRSHQKQ